MSKPVQKLITRDRHDIIYQISLDDKTWLNVNIYSITVSYTDKKGAIKHCILTPHILESLIKEGE